MTDNPTPEEVRASIVPKSDQLNADDLIAGPITVTITKVSRGDREQPIIVEIEGNRPYKPCKTMRRVLIASYTDDPKHWVGQQMTLYCDPDVTWAGVKVGGIRISHLSGLKEPKTFLLTQTRGKKSEVTIFPLKTISPEDQVYIDDAKGEIARAETAESLKAIGFILKKKSEAIQAALRPIYAARQKELMEQS
ncbi:MAG: hypothetical protein ABIH23_04245 [bacterium]